MTWLFLLKTSCYGRFREAYGLPCSRLRRSALGRPAGQARRAATARAAGLSPAPRGRGDLGRAPARRALARAAARRYGRGPDARVASPPRARWTDRHDRRRLFAGG